MKPAKAVSSMSLTREQWNEAAEQEVLPPRLSVVVPAYNEAESLPELCTRIEQVAGQEGLAGAFEIIIVDDGSRDGTPALLARLAAEKPYLKPIRLRRNSGKSLALMAGFRKARGDYVAMMDADLQDRPEDLVVLLREIGEGYDMVSGWRRNRQDTLRRRLVSRLFNRMVKRWTGLALHDFNCGLKLFTREVAKHLCIYGHHHRYIPLHAHLAGFKVTEAAIQNAARKHGKSRYRTLRYEGFFDLLTILFNHKYGHNPMHFFGIMSAVIAAPALVALACLTYEQVLYWLTHEGEPVLNRPLLSFSLTMLVLSIIIFVTGFVCDFMLHHRIRDRIDEILALGVETKPRSKEARTGLAPQPGAAGNPRLGSRGRNQDFEFATAEQRKSWGARNE
jgi:glycosyltransferase involved in cell wall biosynthesis